MPTVNCLVELTEMPFTVMTLSEVNLVNLERVGFNLRNFDMVFIWKDLNRDVGRIDTIPQQSLETIKDWLTSIEIKYYESKLNLNWKNIFKSIKEDPEGFVQDGGWNFLDAEQSDSEQSGEEESDFAPSEGEEGEEEESEEESSDESVVESDDDSDVELDSDEEDLGWDELEELAIREDRQKEFSDDEETRMKRKRADGGGGGAKKSRR
jgi:nucleosome binding factor SPN SPT16 subunit